MKQGHDTLLPGVGLFLLGGALLGFSSHSLGATVAVAGLLLLARGCWKGA